MAAARRHHLPQPLLLALLAAAAAACLPAYVQASEGDVAYPFRYCVWQCRIDGGGLGKGCVALPDQPAAAASAAAGGISTAGGVSALTACSSVCKAYAAAAAQRAAKSRSTAARGGGNSGALGSRGHWYQPVPLPLRLAQWSCLDDCRYICMHAIEARKAVAAAVVALAATANGVNGSSNSDDSSGSSAVSVVKYHGKWPFRRVLGMQEFMSVVFSLLNLAAHAHNLAWYLQATRGARNRSGAGSSGSSSRGAAGGTQQQHAAKWTVAGWPVEASAREDEQLNGAAAQQQRQRQERQHQLHHHPPALPLPTVAWLTRMWAGYSAVHMNAWLWSAVFHTRDTWTTERLDYVSADLVVASGLFCAAARTLCARSRARTALLGLATAYGLAHHVAYMLLVKFDYGWNVKVCIVAGVAQALLWLAWCWRVRHPARRLMFWFLALAHAAMLFEVLDFPPLGGLLDAHAVWHAATFPLTYLFYAFLRADARSLMASAVAAASSGSGPG